MARNTLAGTTRGKGKTAVYYQNNPEARAKKDAYNKEYNSKNVKKRTVLSKLRNQAIKKGIVKRYDGNDISHMANGTTKAEPFSKNRGNGTRTPGDRAARGAKKLFKAKKNKNK